MHKHTIPGHIYLIEGHNCIKLGWTKDVQRRLKELSRWPGELKVLKTVTGTMAKELKIHKILGRGYRRLSKEWYPVEIEEEAKLLMDIL